LGVIRAIHKQDVATTRGTWRDIVRGDDGLIKITDFGTDYSLDNLTPGNIRELKTLNPRMKDFTPAQILEDFSKFGENKDCF
jgi:hypothetical protein